MDSTPQPVICPRCGAGNRIGAKFCRGCGEGLLAELPCPACGSQNAPGSRFCDACGHALHPSSELRPRVSGPASFGAGRYRVLRPLGEGGRKRVYLAEDTQLRREVAIATFKSEGIDGSAIGRAKREAESMARLSDHPNIVPIYDIADEDGELYLVSQYMAGGDLEALLSQADNRRLDVREAVRISTEIARALEHAHANGVVHRDVKPGNVWLSPDGTAKLGDFGLAMATDGQRLTAEGATVGTVAYMAPEQGMGKPAEPRSDLYALGVVAYEMLCGVPPFVGEDAASVISQHVSRSPVGPTWHRDDVPRALEQVVLRLLAKSPEERPQSATEVRELLSSIAAASSEETPREQETLRQLSGGTFIGREAETRELRALVDEALAGRGRVAMVVGDQGIGKSRLAAEVETYAELSGATLLRGRSTEREGAPAYWPWVQAIRSYVRGLDADTLRAQLGTGVSDVAQIVSEVRERIPGLPESEPLDLEQARFRLFDSVTSFLLNASHGEPIAIFLEDLHLADPSSLSLLEFLSREVSGARIFLLGTYRESDLEPGHPLLEVHASLSREPAYRRLRLGGLSEPEVKAFLEETAHQTMSTPDELALVDAVLEESEGNPFFIEEILRHLIDSGAVYRRGDRWVSDARRVEDLGIPQGMKDAVARSLERLSPECRETLAAAAVIGREFSIPILQAVAGAEAGPLMARLQEGIDAAILQRTPDDVGGYRFLHVATRDALYEELTAATRAELHGAVGEALEEIYESRVEAHLAELARHFAEAGSAGAGSKAADYAWWAGERAVQLAAYDEAAAHYTRALRLFAAGDDDPVRRCELLLALGDAHWRAGASEEADRAFLSAADLARELSLPDQFARAAIGYGGGVGGFSVADTAKERLIELLRAALGMLPARDSVLRARVMARLAVELRLYSSDREEPDRLSREAVEMADRIGDARILLLATYSRQWAVMGPDNLDVQMEAANEVIRLSRIVGDREMEFHGHHLRLIALLQMGKLPKVDAEIRESTRLAKELRQPRYEWQVTVFRGMRALLQGRFAEGKRLAETALAIGGKGVGEPSVPYFGAHAFIFNWAAGTLAELREGGVVFADTYPNSAWPSAFTLLLCEIGELDEARARFNSLAADRFEGIRRDWNWLTAMATLSMTAYYLGDAERGAWLHELLTPYADCFVPILSGAASLGSAQVFLGDAAQAAGRLEEAVEHYERGLEANAAAGAAYFDSRICLHLAEALRGLGEEQRASEVIERGLERARQLGTPLEAERLMALKLEGTSLAGVGTGTSIDLVAQSVEEDRPDLRSAAAPDGTATIMFSDIEDSTRWTQSLGDHRWLEVLEEHNAILRSSVARHGGHEVKSWGDGFMLVFPSARLGVKCAIEIQQDLNSRTADRDAIPIKVRIGLHTGDVLRRDEDLFGTTVNLAARVADKASGDQILVSSVVHDLVAGASEFEFREGPEVELKGLAGRHRLFELPWREAETPAAAGP
jgi:class 3 adenylate cyclase